MRNSKGRKSARAVTIIGGSDGPTSVFIAGKLGGKRENPLRRFRNYFRMKQNQKRRARAIQSIRPEPHTMDELISFIKQKYHAVELSPENSSVQEYRRNTKISIVWREHKAEMERLGYVSPEQKRPQNFEDRAAVEKWYKYMQEYDAAAAGLDDALVPTDTHIYEIHTKPSGTIQIGIEKIRGLLSASFSSSDKKSFSQLQRIQQEIYQYYGVSQKDIDQNTDRYLTLVTILAEPRMRTRRHRRARGNRTAAAKQGCRKKTPAAAKKHK
ncbi:MAG: hypothetical protein K2N94_10990 [Lachnospiraceae bacterium]|nr:hypothetical protein [Lachnospiraceae bacterium]